MENKITHDVCSVKHAGRLDSKLRRFGENPNKILRPYLSQGMNVLDLGCGPGFFTMELAEQVGFGGSVTAVDLQPEMLAIVKKKMNQMDVASRITLHQCEVDNIGVNATYDFILAYYIIHEIPNKEKLWKEIKTLLKPGAKMLVAEPLFHVNKASFNLMKTQLMDAGLTYSNIKGGIMNRSILVEN